jgi:hypothetical protein
MSALTLCRSESHSHPGTGGSGFFVLKEGEPNDQLVSECRRHYPLAAALPLAGVCGCAAVQSRFEPRKNRAFVLSLENSTGNVASFAYE